MPEATMTPADAGNDSAYTSLSLEDAANIDFYDPDDEQETVEAADDQHSETEADEVEDDQEAEYEATDDDDDVAGEEDQDEQGSTPEVSDDATITIDGQTLTIAELKRGYYREADYTRQKQHVSQKEKQLEAMTARVNQSVEAIADFLIKQIPPAPDPNLAYSNPTLFVQQKAAHEAATAQMNDLLGKAGEVKEVTDNLTKEQRAELLARENASLVEKFPQTATDEGRKKFFETATVAARELGFSDAEIQSVTDHRTFAFAYYAALGMKAEKAKAKAREKVQDVPPVAPPRAAHKKGVAAAAVRRNQEAMKRLKRTGSIHDALAIDFD